MERESTQHSPRVDDALARETESLTRGAPVESRADDARSMEAPGDGEPSPDVRTTETEIEQRSRLATALRPRAFPADRQVLLTVAEEERADPEIMAWLRSLPGDRVFVNVQAVWSALGGAVEAREHASTEMIEPPELPAPVDEKPDEGRPLLQRVIEVGVGVAVSAVGLGIAVARRIIRR